MNHLGNLFQNVSYGNPPSSLQIGTYDLSKYSTSESFIVNIPLSFATYWQVSIDQVVFYALNFSSIQAIFDTGTTLLITDLDSTSSDIFDYFLYTKNCVTGELNLIKCACSSSEEMNGISFSVNGVELTIPSTRLWDYTNGNCTLLVESGNFGF